jgi:hypothetical protein
MNRFFVSKDSFHGNKVLLGKDQAHQIRSVPSDVGFNKNIPLIPAAKFLFPLGCLQPQFLREQIPRGQRVCRVRALS